LSRQVPPTREARSRITKSSKPASLSFTPAPMPEKPLPMITAAWTSFTVAGVR
jgi:hypothetical protein